ncbi:MAG TPA: hypothetical protein DEG17_17020 [Cyanobacteria bacterium UBA11149]|nr:hypothetical protein [Cyanobacteria bacterium UBA11367]HBE58051.1 hypothetical protein [Cyanobacteria bacterium UBA11366]HBK66242.1 hypothetical protein [Cyanobacteria bacterium UBA11166]HBR75352.1 hypothetical protein [Cyanobacteria bacterium UBA11159]HBS71933.1 hypothetical protein [Cyanobacteria bacterium UBA11153]HBW90525.1 hypothetical protein [Cyanobacteria bacterium UBA11149]HCA93915.1 hypothetical protein [Cyanobacteria bacterium UBA9226]
MSNRLQFFRQQMAAFEGSGDPRATIESGCYVNQGKKSASEIISHRLALRPSSTHLLIGGIGSGKTTELLVMRDSLNELEDIYAHYVDVSLYTDLSEIVVGTLTAITGIVIAELVKDMKEQSVKKAKESIHKYAFGYSERKISPSRLDLDLERLVENLTKMPKTLMNRSTEVVINHKGILNPNPTNNIDVPEYLQSLNQLNNIAKKKYGKFIMLLDGLDRLDNVQVFSQLVTSDLKTISSMDIGVVLVAPLIATLGSYRDTIEQSVNYLIYQHCFDVDKDPDAFTFFENIIKVRAADGFMEQSAIKSLIHYSGGVMRDLINLTQASIEEAYLLDSDRIQEKHVEAAVDSLGRAKLLGISDKEIEIIEHLLREGKFIPRTDEDIRLLVTNRILEYRYPVRRYVVHPTLEPLIPQSKVGSNLND